MKDEIEKHFEASPYGRLTLASLQIGRIKLGETTIEGREAAINFLDLIDSLIIRTRRFTAGNAHSRYPSPLPMPIPGRVLSVEAKDYLDELKRRRRRHSTIYKVERTLRILQIVCGDIPVTKIDHKHISAFLEFLRWAPRKLTRDPALRGKSMEDLIAIGKAQEVPPLAPKTYNLQLILLATFFNRLKTMGVIPVSPLAGFEPMKEDIARPFAKTPRLLEDEDLKRIFDPETFVPWARKFPHRWWAPILGLYTGARINEIAQLKVTDIICDEGTWCISICPTIDADLAGGSGPSSRQAVKGESSVRKIPIAQPVLDAGFLDFVEDIKACGHPRLFPQLSAGTNRRTAETNGRYCQALLVQFSAYLKTKGFPKGLGFHAFRHTLSTRLREQNIDEQEIAWITGHSISNPVPVLRQSYIHVSANRVRESQRRNLAVYRPPVELPRYQRGQFAHCLRKGARMYP